MPDPQRPVAVVSGLPTDAHTWNLVYLQLLLEETGYDVVNLGACVPADELVACCRRSRARLVVLGTVNGHGFRDGAGVIAALRAAPGLAGVPVVIGGLLDTTGGDPRIVDALRAAWFDAVFPQQEGVARFVAYAAASAGAAVPMPAAV